METGLIGILLNATRAFLKQEEWDAAVDSTDKVLELARTAKDEPAESEALELRATALSKLERTDEAKETWSSCVTLREESGDSLGAAHALAELGTLLRQQGNPAEAKAVLLRSLRYSASEKPGPERARALRELAVAERHSGSLREAIPRLEEALRIREAMEDGAGIGQCHRDLGNVYQKLGELTEAVGHYNEFLEVANRSGHDAIGRADLASVQNNLAGAYQKLGRLDAAVQSYEEAFSNFSATGGKKAAAITLGNLGTLRSLMGDVRQAESHLRECLRQLEELNDLRWHSYFMNNLALVCHMCGRYEESLEMAEQSIRLREETGRHEGLSQPWFHKGITLLELDRRDEAEHAASVVRKIAEESKSDEYQATSWVLDATVALRVRNHSAALEHAEAALDLARRSEQKPLVAEALRLKGEAHLEADDRQAAREAFVESESIFRELSDAFHLALCRLGLGKLFLLVGSAEAAADRLRYSLEVFESFGNRDRKWEALMALAETLWLVSPSDSRVYLTRAAELADETGRSELIARTQALQSRLLHGSSFDEARVRLADLFRTFAGRIRDADDWTVAVRTALREMNSRLDLFWSEFWLEGGTVCSTGSLPPALTRAAVDSIVSTARRTRAAAQSTVGVTNGVTNAVTDGVTDGVTNAIKDAIKGDCFLHAVPIIRVGSSESGALVAAVPGTPEESASSTAVLSALAEILSLRFAAVKPGGASDPYAGFAGTNANEGAGTNVHTHGGGRGGTAPGSGGSGDSGDSGGSGGRSGGGTGGNRGRSGGGSGGGSGGPGGGSRPRLGGVIDASTDGGHAASGHIRAANSDAAGSGTGNGDELPVFAGMVGQSVAMRTVFRVIERIAPSEVSVLITGESGTGKELVAQAVHDYSNRGGPFIALNCPSFPKDLIESELFGYEKGAFTGADRQRKGQVELADGGTLFLDEVGDLEMQTQTKLLRFLEQREFLRVGGRTPIGVDVRLLAATSRNLEEAMEAGKFRRDLFHRLKVVPIELPALRERADDIPLLCVKFLRDLTPAGEPIRSLSTDAQEVLTEQSWLGNIRELRNLMHRLVATVESRVITVDHLPEEYRGPVGKSTQGVTPIREGETLGSRLMSIEGSILRETLADCDWNQSSAARRLGVDESTVREKMKRFGIVNPNARTGKQKTTTRTARNARNSAERGTGNGAARGAERGTGDGAGRSTTRSRRPRN